MGHQKEKAKDEAKAKDTDDRARAKASLGTLGNGDLGDTTSQAVAKAKARDPTMNGITTGTTVQRRKSTTEAKVKERKESLKLPANRTLVAKVQEKLVDTVVQNGMVQQTVQWTALMLHRLTTKAPRRQ